MLSTDIQSSSSSSSSSPPSFGFSTMIRRRDQIHSMESTQSQEIESISFQKHVAERFHRLSSDSNEALLSIPWIQKLLDTFLCCQEEFRMIMFNNQSHLSKPPMDRYMSEYFERTLKALDLCNAIRDGIEQIRQWHKLLEIVHCALNNSQHRTIGEGQFRRAKKGMIDLAISMLDEKDSNNSTVAAHRNRSFGRISNNNTAIKVRSLRHFRSLSWSVSRNWSAAKQLQAISSNLVAPRVNEIASTNGLNAAVFTMNYVLVFVMWALVAAIPCQDRGLQTHFNLTRQFVWAGPMLSLHERILEESKRRDRKNSCGLLKEIHEIEICARHVNELTDSVQFPLTDGKEREVREIVREVGKVCEALGHGLDPLERQVREVFHRIVRSRAQSLDSIGG